MLKLFFEKILSGLLGAAAGVASAIAAPTVLGWIFGIGALGPLAGGFFAGMQGAGLAAGSLLSLIQSVVMGGTSGIAVKVAALLGAALLALLHDRSSGPEARHGTE